jgi:putative copper export protein
VAAPRRRRHATQRRHLLKRFAVWILYVVGTIAIGYLALYAYVAFTGRELQPGDPIHIFRRPDAPSYS